MLDLCVLTVFIERKGTQVRGDASGGSRMHYSYPT